MYRPNSQIIRRQSNDIKDNKSKTKKLNNKHYKQYIKRLIENNPNHVDYEKKAKLGEQTSNTNNNNNNSNNNNKYDGFKQLTYNNYDLKTMLVNLKDDERDREIVLRSGFGRFMKMRLNEKDYRRFRRLFELYQKIDKMKQQIITINCLCNGSTANINNHNHKITKQILNHNNNNMNINSERLKELKQQTLRLELQEEKLLLQIESEMKENNLKENGKEKQVLTEKRKSDYYQNVIIEKQTVGNAHHHVVTVNYLRDLLAVIRQIDPTYEKVSGRRTREQLEYQKQSKLYEEIRQFITTKQKTIDQLFVSLNKLANINNAGSNLEIRKSLSKMDHPSNKQTDEIEQLQHEKLLSPQLSQSHSHNNNTKVRSSKKSFKSLLTQLQQSLMLIPQINTLKQRNTELAKKLLSSTKLLNIKQQQIQKIQKRERQLQQKSDTKTKQKIMLMNKVNRLEMELEEMRIKHEREMTQVRQDEEEKTNEQILRVRDQHNQSIEQLKQSYQQHIQRIRHQNSTLTDKLKQLQSDILKMGQRQKCNREVLNYQCEMRVLVGQNDKLKKELDRIKEEYERVKSCKDNKQKQDEGYSFKLNISSEQSGNSLNNLNNQMNVGHTNTTNQSPSIPIKSPSSTSTNPTHSLIYKQQQKKNKKLSKQLIQLKQQNQKLKLDLTSLKQQQFTIISIKQQNLRLIQQISNKLEQIQNLKEQLRIYNEMNEYENTKKVNQHHYDVQGLIQQKQQFRLSYQKLLVENIKLQEEFQYLVREKLTIQEVNHKLLTKLDAFDQNRRRFYEKLQEMQDSISEIEQFRNYVRKEVIEMTEAVKIITEKVIRTIVTEVEENYVMNVVSEEDEQKQKQKQAREYRLDLNLINVNYTPVYKSDEPVQCYQSSCVFSHEQQLQQTGVNTTSHQQEKQETILFEDWIKRQSELQHDELIQLTDFLSLYLASQPPRIDLQPLKAIQLQQQQSFDLQIV